MSFEYFIPWELPLLRQSPAIHFFLSIAASYGDKRQLSLIQNAYQSMHYKLIIWYRVSQTFTAYKTYQQTTMKLLLSLYI